MNVLSPGQIFLSDQRGVEETAAYRRYSTFNGNDASRAPFGSLTQFNDEIIAAGQTVEITVEHNCFIMVMAVTGAVEVKVGHGLMQQPDAGQLIFSYVKKDTTIQLKNGYEADWINLLYLQIEADVFAGFTPQLIDFDLSSQPDGLISLAPAGVPFGLHIGMFQGRSEALYKVRSRQSRLFSFVLSGAFEFQGRLMHERDGLALWDLVEADMEALSNNAIVVLVEMY